MDHRIALKSNTPLRLCNDRGEAIHCVIENEIGRGGSCIVYEAVRITDTGDKTLYRVKEFYPYKLNISRDENNTLTPSAKDAEVFNQRQEQFRSDFSRTNQLFYSDNNYSSITNQLDVFRQNGTSYILSAYSSKKTLATYKPLTLKECVTLVKQVAYVLGNIHKQGYLYLDTKPDNVLIVDGYQKQVQLFDFDSLLEWKEAHIISKQSCSDIRLSYSKGFAPIELQTSKIKRLGPHTDVYGVGALLFYLLFGYTPTAPDCETDAVFDFTKIQYDYRKCDDRLFGSLSDFFHNALAVYYADRYSSMQKVVEQLQEIEKYADLVIPRIYSTQIAKPKIFYGREREFEELDRLLANSDYNCLFVTGMGGIGKSAFIREYLTRRRGKFDTVLYVHYKGSIEATISNDSNIEINTLRQDEETKTGTRYFDKKLQKICELVRGTSSVLVIDNFTGDVDDDLRALLSTELKVILLSRKAPSYQSCQEMNLSVVSDLNALRRIFEDNLGRSIEDNEQDGFEQILKRVEGHTLVLELIAKQIANSHITISSAASLTDEHGFSAIAPEKVDYEKDNKQTSDTIGNIIDALFAANMLSSEKKVLMKIASLLGDDGIDINYFQQIMQLVSKDDLNELIKDGWLTISSDTISMHTVIQEAVHRWEWTPEYVNAAEQFLTYFYVEIRLESTKNNYPKKLRKYITAADAELPPELKDKWIFQKLIAYRDRSMKKIDKWRKKKFDEQGLIGKVNRERYSRIKDESPADIEKLTKLLFQAESIIKQCQREEVICDTDLFINLQFTVLLNMPRYREDFIFSETSRLLADNAKAIDFGDYADSMHDMRQDAVVIMRVYELVFSIHAAHGDKEAMKDWLDSADKASRHFRKQEAYAIYYNMVSDYYDILLDGSYDTEDPDKELLLNKLLDAIEKTLHYSKRGLSHDGNHLYAKNILAKATILMRSGRGTEKEISDLIDTAKKIIAENTSQYADVRLQYYLVCAWYFALVHDSAKSTNVFVKDARELSAIITPTDLQKIEDVIIPCANIFFELSCHGRAMALLYEGTRLCAKHANTDSYARIRQELCDHLWQVGIDAQQFELCQKTIELIEAENEEIVDPKNRVVIPAEVRSIISDKTT
ncbi:MAG: AAA family ATPase [Clostridia bacterium]|nr:AAA family ATPase [Clostridia bacterium]